MKWLLIGLIRLWRAVISPLYGNVCKYYPSCSSYGLEAVRTHGCVPGAWLTLTRIVRCNPWSAGGYDPVPGTPAAEQWAQEQAHAAALSDPPIGNGHSGFPERIGHTGGIADPPAENFSVVDSDSGGRIVRDGTI